MRLHVCPKKIFKKKAKITQIVPFHDLAGENLQLGRFIQCMQFTRIFNHKMKKKWFMFFENS